MGAIQQTILTIQGLGIEGEIYSNSPTRINRYALNSPDTDLYPNAFGRAFTMVQGTNELITVRPGGTSGVFAGYMVSPKEYYNRGNSVEGPLGPSLTLPNGMVAQFLTLGQIVVYVSGASLVGNKVIFNNDTGLLSSIAPSGSIPVGSSDGYATVLLPNSSQSGYTVIQVNAPNGAI